MACPAENTWLGFLSGRLGNASFDDLERHLDGCPSCQFLYAGLARRDGGIARAIQGADAFGPLPSSASLELRPGMLVGRYVILGLLGRGGMGVVYKAFDPELDRPIALKLVGLAGLGSGADQAGARLQREARTLARLSHPNVVAVHDVGRFADDVFVAMEFVAGTTLRTWLGLKQRSPREVIAIFLAAGAGLAAAHELGIVHLDFKPENVIVGDDGRVRVLDFGLARSVAHAVSSGRPRQSAEHRATQEGAVVGTPAYMAPEQDAGEKVDAKSDQFSFCVALYEALYGRLPYQGETYVEMAARRHDGELVAPAPMAGVSGRVRRALTTGLSAAPGDRHRDMDALLGEIGAQRWTRRRIVVAALALVVAAGGFAAWTAVRSPPSLATTCAEAGTEFEWAWNPTRRSAVLASLSTSGHPRGRAIGEEVVAGVDRWTAGWARERRQLCAEAVRGADDRDEHVSDRLKCLVKRLNTLDAIMHMFSDALQPEIVERATTVVAELPDPAACASLVKPVISQQQKEIWKPTIRELVQGQLALAKGQPAEAKKLAAAAVERSRKDGEKEPLGASLLLLGRSQTALGEFKAGRASLREAIRNLAEMDEDGLLVEAWFEIISSLAFHERRLGEELDAAIFGAELAVLQIPRDEPDRDARRAALAYWVGSARLMQGNLDEALSQLQQSSLEWAKAGKFKHRFDIAAVENSLGMVHSDRGEWEAARRSFDRALAAWKQFGPHNVNTGVTTGNIAALLERQREDAEAERLARDALAVLEAAGEAGRTHIPEAHLQLGALLTRTGRCDQAEPHLGRARELGTEQHGPDSVVVGATLISEGLCLLGRKQVARAIATLERARALVAEVPPSNSLRSDAAYALARALWAGGRRKRAMELAENAYAGLGTIPGTRAARAEVGAWIAARR
jgi:tetratricopeptide (TPR) repeat protein